MSSSTDLLPIIGTENPKRIADIVFIHGLGGDARGTWHPENKKDDDDFWLMWLGKDIENIGIWSLSYEIEPVKWKGSTMPLVNLAINILDLLDINDIGQRQIIFVTHSMGGLIIKQMLRHANDYGNPVWKQITINTKGIIYLSTPHSASSIIGWLKYIKISLGTSVSLPELKANDSLLIELNAIYRNHSVLSKIPSEIFSEARTTSGIMVVDRTSADPGIPGIVPILVDEDHISIASPKSPKSLIYRRTKRFIEQNLTKNQTPI